jgi:hypothetical protein
MGKLAVVRHNDSPSHVKHFSVSSRWLYEDDNRLDATTYSAGAFQALTAIEACRFDKRSFGSLCGTLRRSGELTHGCFPRRTQAF